MRTSDESAMIRHDQLAARVYSETRMPATTRDLILALGWVTLRDPRRHDPAEAVSKPSRMLSKD